MLEANFKSDVWKQFGFTVSRTEKKEKVTGKRKEKNTQEPPVLELTHTYGTF